MIEIKNRSGDEARAGEDHWKVQRDAALRLLLWVIGDLLPVEER